MVQSKFELFDVKLQHHAEFFKALSHPARLAILEYLAKIKTCITGDISHILPLSRTTVNQHLYELKKAGLIKGEIEGVKTKYCLNPSKIKELKKLNESFFSTIEILDNNAC